MNIYIFKKILFAIIFINVFIFIFFESFSKIKNTSEILKIDKINEERKVLESIDDDTYNIMNDYILKGYEFEDFTVNLTNEDDIEELGQYFMDSAMLLYTDDININDTKTGKEYLRKCLKRPDSYYFTIKLKENKLPIGQINIKFYDKGEMTISYWVGSKYRRNGVMSRIGIHFVEDVFFKLKNIHVLIIYLLEQNEASNRFAQKLHNYMKENHKCESITTLKKVNGENTKFYFLRKLY